MVPDPFDEIHIATLHATRGPNYWSRRSVTRMDLLVGAFEDLSSARAPGVAESLVAALPGLVEHQCSIGERGGFILRLQRGTYVPHIIEHVALELQVMIGHDVGYGRTRGGDTPGEYTLVFEHRHEPVGLRAAALALETVQRAFAGTLDSVEHAVAELASLARVDDTPVLRQEVLCGITGGSDRADTRAELTRHGFASDDLIIDVAPGYLLRQGVPYSHSEIAIVLDATLTDVPLRYREPERARRLVAILADAVVPEGILIAPAKEWEVQDLARDAGCRVAVFAIDDDITARDRKVARASAWVSGGRICGEHAGETLALGTVRDGVSVTAQVAAALAAFTLDELHTRTAASVRDA